MIIGVNIDSLEVVTTLCLVLKVLIKTILLMRWLQARGVSLFFVLLPHKSAWISKKAQRPLVVSMSFSLVYIYVAEFVFKHEIFPVGRESFDNSLTLMILCSITKRGYETTTNNNGLNKNPCLYMR